MLVFAFAVGIALVVSFVCSVFESVLLSIRPAQVQELETRGRRSGTVLKRFQSDMHIPIAAILILNTVAHTYGSSQGGVSFEAVFPKLPLWVFQVVFTIAVLVFTEIMPKTLGVAFHRSLAAPVALMVDGIVKVLRPLLYLTGLLSRLIGSKSESPAVSAEEIRLMAALGKSQGVVGASTANIIEGAINLRVFRVDDVMVPRNEVNYLSAERSMAENLEVIRRSGHSRFPFCKGSDLDDIEGVVLAKELLFRLHHSESTEGPFDWEPIVREPLIVPETMTLHRLLKTIKERHQHLAIVIDEYGGVSGIVTLEDVLEELVGEIDDESDHPTSTIDRLPDGRLRCRGVTELRHLESLLGMTIESSASTVSGFLAERLNGIPAEGQSVREGSFLFKVTRASHRRAEWVEIQQETAAA